MLPESCAFPHRPEQNFEISILSLVGCTLVGKHNSSLDAAVKTSCCLMCRKKKNGNFHNPNWLIRRETDMSTAVKSAVSPCRESLSIHITVHSGKLECQPCQKLYTSRNLFEKHIAYMHEIRRPVRSIRSKMKSVSPTEGNKE